VAAHAGQHEAAVGVAVDQLVVHRRHVGQQPQPAEGVDLLVLVIARCGTLARHTPWKPSQPAMKSQSRRCSTPSLTEGDPGLLAVEAVHRTSSASYTVGRPTAARCVHQVARDLGLAVDHHALAGQAEQVDAVALAAEAQLEAVVRQAFGVHARAPTPASSQQVDRHLLQHAGADAAEHVVGAALLDDDVVDAGLVQQGAEQQARAGPAPMMATWVRMGVVGYEVDVPMSTFFNLPGVGERVTLLTHFVVREDAQLLYGFLTAAERDAFRQLVKISGVGPRTALSVLSGLSVAELAHAVSVQDGARLVKVPGIGKKTAERLLLELKGKLGPDLALPSQAAATTEAGSDIVQALVALGYSEKEANAALKALPPDVGVSDGIKQALKALNK
jgi:Holliday junction DNA helicase RuvA